MAMVDSAVGGKTAVNHEKAKNMIGTFYQPEAVVIDIDTLLTLPDRELKSGLSEIIKYGLIRDRGFFEWLECNMEQILKRNALALTHAIKASCINKAEVVRLDEKESSSGVRATLNLGHTFGHAIENGLGYGTWLHGEAVAAGIVLASDMSLQSGLIDSQLFSRIKELIVKAGLPIDLKDEKKFFASNDKDCVENKKKYDEKVDNLTSEKFLELMSIDKKVAHGKLNLVLLQGEEVGRAIVTDDFDESILKKIVFEYCHKPSTTI
jgi:3-dehydroquinate synthase